MPRSHIPHLAHGMRRARALSCLALVPALLTACDRGSAPELRPESRRASAFLADPDAIQWNTFEADVNVTFSGNRTLSNVPSASSGTGYHFRRRLLGNGHWATDFTFGALVPVDRRAPTPDDPPAAATLTAFDDCTPAMFRDRSGAAIPVPESPFTPLPLPGADLRAPAPSGARPVIPAPAPCGYGTRAVHSGPGHLRSVRGSGHDAPDREWIARYVVTPANAARLRARLMTTMGHPRHEGGHSRFSRDSAGRSVDLYVDDATGAVDEVHVRDGGRVTAIVSRTYARQSNGFLVLTREHIAGADDVQSMDLSYDNIRIGRDG